MMPQFYGNPKIILVGVDPNFIEIIVSFLEMAFDFVDFNPQTTSIQDLKKYKNIQLFIVNTDNIAMKIPKLMEQLASDTHFDNIPKLGLAHKKHIGDMPVDLRFQFHDLLLMPAGCEDLLNRIDVWIKTFEILNGNVVENYCEMQ